MNPTIKEEKVEDKMYEADNGSTMVDRFKKGRGLVKGKQVTVMNTQKDNMRITQFPQLKEKTVLCQDRSLILVNVKKQECLWVKLA